MEIVCLWNKDQIIRSHLINLYLCLLVVLTNILFQKKVTNRVATFVEAYRPLKHKGNVGNTAFQEICLPQAAPIAVRFDDCMRDKWVPVKM